MNHPLARGRAAARAFARLVRARRPVMFLDLDGTLAPLVERPEAARVPARTRRILGRLRASGATIVIVSGRSISGVQHIARFSPDAILGDHGARIWRRGSVRPWLASDPGRLERVVRRVAPEIETFPGVRLEQKDRSLAIHLRLSRSSGRGVIRGIRASLEAAGLRVLLGRNVIDAQLPGVDKGRAVRRWLRANGTPDAVLYAGDDTTDRDAFLALPPGAVTIAVGRQVEGAALRTRDPDTFARWLARLAAARLAR